MESTVRAMFDFDGDTVNGELSFAENEILTITNKDVGEGWWMGKKADGTIGLLPESYVEDVPTEAPSVQAPTLPPSPPTQQFEQEELPVMNIESNCKQEWDDQSDDNWATDDLSAAQPQTTAIAKPLSPTQSHQSNDNTLDPGSPVKKSTRKNTVRAAKSIFSTFTKTSAAESFILGESKAYVIGAPKCLVTFGPDGPMWESDPHVFSCTISDPVKETKFSGLKSFIAYSITPSHTNEPVLRRFKHFDWLYEQLFRKYGVAISVPPLPDKQITGRYDEDFIEERRSQLESWIGRISLHPVISRSEVVQHFVTCNEDEKAWKAGKRKAEKDDAVGGAFLNTIETPQEHLNLGHAEQTLETHIKFTKSMDDACKQLISLGQDHVKKCFGSYRKEYEKLGQVFGSLSESFELDEREVSHPLTEALKHTGQCYEGVGELYYQQPKYDWNPFLAGLHEYKTVLSTFPGILGNQRSAFEKTREVRKLQLENKMTEQEMKDVTSRTEKLSYSVQAEVNHFQHYRVGDFAIYIKNFLDQQIAFHKEILKKLEEAQVDYQSLVQE